MGAGKVESQQTESELRTSEKRRTFLVSISGLTSNQNIGGQFQNILVTLAVIGVSCHFTTVIAVSAHSWLRLYFTLLPWQFAQHSSRWKATQQNCTFYLNTRSQSLIQDVIFSVIGHATKFCRVAKSNGRSLQCLEVCETPLMNNLKSDNLLLALSFLSDSLWCLGKAFQPQLY